MAISRQASAQNLHASASPSSGAIGGGWTPALDDVVLLFIHTTNTTTINTVPSGWVNVLGGTTLVTPGDTTEYLTVLYHKVDAGEVSGGTTTYTVTSLFTTSETCMVMSVVYRGVDATTVVDNFGTSFNAGTSTTHVLPGITGTGSALENNSVVVASVSGDSAGAYTDPSGWTMLQTQSAADPGAWLGEHNTLTTANTNVTATNITFAAAQEYVSCSVALLAAVTGGSETANPVDNVGITDSAALNRAIVREFTDNLGLTDAADVGVGEGLDDADDIGITDSATVQVGLLLTEVDNVGITDTVVVVIANVLQITDSIGITDAFLGVMDEVFEINPDNIGITDSLVLTVGGSAEFSDNVGITEDVLVLLDKFFNLETDEIGIDDSVVVQVGLVVTVTDTIGIDDDVTVDDVETPVGPIDICIEFGAPVFLDRETAALFLTRMTEAVFADRDVGAAVFEDRSVDDAVFVDRDTDVLFEDRSVGTPEFVDRTATVQFDDRQPGEPQIACEVT